MTGLHSMLLLSSPVPCACLTMTRAVPRWGRVNLPCASVDVFKATVYGGSNLYPLDRAACLLRGVAGQEGLAGTWIQVWRHMRRRKQVAVACSRVRLLAGKEDHATLPPLGWGTSASAVQHQGTERRAPPNDYGNNSQRWQL